MRILQQLVAAASSTVPVPVVVKRSIMISKDLRKLEPGQVAELPAYMARILVRSGYAELPDSEQVDLERLRNLLYLETRSPSIEASLPPNFYQLARLSMVNLRGEELREYASQLVELARVRLRKILLSVVNSPNSVENILDKLSVEEQIFARVVSEAVKIFEAELLAHS